MYYDYELLGAGRFFNSLKESTAEQKHYNDLTVNGSSLEISCLIKAFTAGNIWIFPLIFMCSLIKHTKV